MIEIKLTSEEQLELDILLKIEIKRLEKILADSEIELVHSDYKKTLPLLKSIQKKVDFVNV